jgi:WD40 repeat protein
VWDAATAQEITVLSGHTKYLVTAAFSPDGARIVTASADGTTRVVDAQTGEEIVLLRGHGNIVKSAEFNWDGSRIVTASDDQTARLWEAATGREIAVLISYEAPPSPLACAAGSPS